MMPELITYDHPFRLRVQMAIQAAINAVTVANGYNHDLAGKVFRGRDSFGDNDPLPMVSILEAPLPVDQIIPPRGSSASTGEWDLLIQGFVDDDFGNPTDPAHLLMADVKRRLVIEKTRTTEQRVPNILGMGVAQIVNGRAIGNTVDDMRIGSGVVRPPEAAVSNKAYFWLGLTLKITEDISRPFL